VHVVVGVEEGGSAAGDGIVEEGALGELFVGFYEVVDPAVEDADLEMLGVVGSRRRGKGTYRPAEGHAFPVEGDE
jgi:hypothetical protein